MSEKQLFVSRDLSGVCGLWEGKPQWTDEYVCRSTIALLFVSPTKRFRKLFQHLELEPGQCAKVQRDMVEGCTGLPDVVIFTLGDIVEDHGIK